MARAGYDPRDLGRMFETIEKEGERRRPPQWLSSHPNPGNRSQYIAEEAAAAAHRTAPSDPAASAPIKQRFAALPPAKSMAEIEKRGTAAAAAGGAGSVGTRRSSRCRRRHVSTAPRRAASCSR